jgi:four helix bundle protein
MVNGKELILTHKNLDAWKEAIKLTIEIYNLTKSFPKEELYGITNQIRRSAVSIPSNIAEGCARQSSKETIQFLHIALGSAAELETQLIISNELKYSKDTNEIFNTLNHIRKLVVGLIKFQRAKNE